MKYPKYPAYKDGGVEWIGEIPEHWHTVRLKFLCQLCADYGANIKSEYYSESGVRFIRITDINEDGTIVPDGVFVPDYLVKEKMLKNGDLLFARSGSVGTSYIHDQNDSSLYSFAGYLVRFRVKDGNFAKFIYFFSKSQSYYDQIQALSIESTIQNFNGEKFSNMYLPIVDPAEQIIIAKFIDNKTSKIETIISNLQKMIELLKEKRQAIITHAVTKGLDPNVPTKDSGVEWIGEIPEHWKLVRLKRLVNLATKSTKNNGTKVALENIESWTGKYVRTLSEYDSEGIAFEKGDILFGKLRPYLAKVYLTDFDGEAVGDFYVLRISSNVDDMFLFQLLATREFISIVDSSTYGTKMPRVNWDFMGNLKVPIPALREQSNIGSFIVKIVNKTDILVSNLKKMIELLKEYRSTLISAAVTGKIDVRNLKNNDFPESE